MSSTCVGDYKVIDKLGKGTFGDVFKVERDADGKLFALKRIPTPYFKASMDRLEREVRSHKSLPPHPNILEFIEYFKLSGYMNIVLELCDMGNLEEYIMSREMEPDTARSFMLDMARGLNHLHKNGIVHRDIKPENMLLCKGRYGIPLCKISDFGVANMSLDDADKTDKLGSLPGEDYFKTMCGTPIYIAPEVTVRHYTKSCDIFSLGIVFYILFSPQRSPDGRVAPWVKNGTLFYRATDSQIEEQIREYVRDEKLCQLIARMMVVDYHDRISASAVMEKLEEMDVTDDEVFIVVCLLFGLCVAFVLFPFPLIVLCLAVLVLAAKELLPKSLISKVFRGI